MTTTMLRSETATRPVSGAELLRDLMHDALAVAADESVGAFDCPAAGRALLSLAALARQAAGALGAEPGRTVAAGPGVVLVRELAAAVRLLDLAVSRSAGPVDVDGLLATAKGLHAHLHDAVAATAR